MTDDKTVRVTPRISKLSETKTHSVYSVIQRRVDSFTQIPDKYTLIRPNLDADRVMSYKILHKSNLFVHGIEYGYEIIHTKVDDNMSPEIYHIITGLDTYYPFTQDEIRSGIPISVLGKIDNRLGIDSPMANSQFGSERFDSTQYDDVEDELMNKLVNFFQTIDG